MNPQTQQVNQQAMDYFANNPSPLISNVQPQTTASNVATPPPTVNVPTPQMPTTPSTFVNNLTPTIDAGNQGVQNIQQRIIEAQTAEASQRNNVLNQLLSIDGVNTQNTYERAFGNTIQSLTGQDPDAFMQQLTDANMALATLQGKFRSGAQAISGAQGQTKRFEGVQLNELERQRAVEVGNQALIVQALQGNFDTARQIALDTANFASEDKKTELNNLLAQYDALTGIVDQQTQQLLDQEKQKIQAELMDTERTQNLVDSAIVQGLATVEEMQYLTSTEVDNATKQRIAMEIINRGARSDRFASAGGGVEGDTVGASSQASQLPFLKETAQLALDLAKVSGSSGINRTIRDIFKGSNKFRQLENLTDTLKTNILTLAGDPNVRKFFGPQMSEADVRMMMAGGTTLDPMKQTPSQMTAELNRVYSMFDRIEKSLPEELKGLTDQTSSPQQMTVNGTIYTLGADGKYYAQ